MNQLVLVGRVGKDAEVKGIGGSGKSNPVMNFSLAVKEGFGDKASTLWFACAMWGDRVHKLSGYVKKGTLVAVTGRIERPSIWKDKAGESQADLRVTIQDLEPLGSKSDQGSAAPSGSVPEDVSF